MNSHPAPYAPPHDRDYPTMWSSLVAIVIVTAIFAAIGTIASIAAPSFYLGLNRHPVYSDRYGRCCIS
jgi:hypothetical protein